MSLKYTILTILLCGLLPIMAKAQIRGTFYGHDLESLSCSSLCLQEDGSYCYLMCMGKAKYIDYGHYTLHSDTMTLNSDEQNISNVAVDQWNSDQHCDSIYITLSTISREMTVDVVVNDSIIYNLADTVSYPAGMLKLDKRVVRSIRLEPKKVLDSKTIEEVTIEPKNYNNIKVIVDDTYAYSRLVIKNEQWRYIQGGLAPINRNSIVMPMQTTQ